MKYAYKKPKTTGARHDEETLEECSRLTRRYFNLEDAIRRDKQDIDRITAQIRYLGREKADIEAEDNTPKVVTPGFSISRGKPRIVLSPSQVGLAQFDEIARATQLQANARRRIAKINDELERLEYERGRLIRLRSDSMDARSKVLDDMRDLGCPAAGSASF
ncbi:MAG: hypothetical protein RKE49_01365 [Oceanicaulis sp.]